MNHPVLGFRAWKVTGARVAPLAADLMAYRPTPRYVERPEIEEWLKLGAASPKKLTRADVKVPAEPGVLMPVTSGAKSIWAKPGPVEFRCKAHDQPHRDCQCGLHAFFALEALQKSWYMKEKVVGAIIGWGHIVFHETQGFRAQFAQVVALSGRSHGASLAAERYGVPLVDIAELEEVGREFGTKVSWEYRFE